MHCCIYGAQGILLFAYSKTAVFTRLPDGGKKRKIIFCRNTALFRPINKKDGMSRKATE